MPNKPGGRRILVTGAGGFVGGHLLTELASAGYAPDEIHAVIVSQHAPPPGAGHAHVCDLRDGAALNALIRELKPTGVVHLAAVALPAQAKQDPSAAWAVNFEAVRQLAHAILASVPDCPLAFAGSSESYGHTFNLAGGPVDESMALRPMTPYAATKAAADVALGQMRHDGLKAFRFRAFNHTGPGQPPDYVVPSFAKQIAEIARSGQGGVIRVGNLDAERDFLDVRDVVRAYRLALETTLDAGSEGVFNLASGRPRSIRSILDSLIEIAGVDVSIETDVTKLRANDVPRTCGAIERAGREMGWTPCVPFEKTLSDTLTAMLAPPEGHVP